MTALVAGRGTVLPRANPVGYLRLHGEGTTHPQRRGTGLGGEALAWMRRRAAEIPPEKSLALDAHLEIVAFLDNQAQIDLLEAQGFEAVNWSALMRVPLDTGATIPEPHWPDGLLPRDYDASWSAPMREAHNEAFVDHWGFTAWSAEEWRQRVDASKNFRPDMSWIVVDATADPDVVVGYVQTNEFEANQAATQRRGAFLAKLGVRRSHRGRGLATALLRHALSAYRAVGYDESALDVDTDDPTGAFRLYETIGYRVEARTVTYQLVVPALSR